MLHSISFKNLPELTTITCSYNDLTNIDVTQNTKLRILYCYNNANLASIDLKNNSALFSLKCKNTKITTLDLSVCDEDIKSYLSPKPRKGLLILGVFTATIIHCKGKVQSSFGFYLYSFKPTYVLYYELSSMNLQLGDEL